MNNSEKAEHIFLAGVKGVLPGKLIGDLFSVRGSMLKIGYLSFDLEKTGNIFVLGAGKAGAAMGHYVEKTPGMRITEGHIITKYGHYCKLDHIKVTEAGHPVPDQNSFRATEEILQIADKASDNDLVICLLSGGGSSLLADCPENTTPEEIIRLNELLVNCGADITEMNSVRKHLSKVKGGQLAKRIWPASSVTLLISDVTGNKTDTIASGPTVPDNSTFSDALHVVDKYNLAGKISPGLLNHLHEGVRGDRPETPKPGDAVFEKAVTLIAGDIKTALQSSKSEAENLGYNTFILTDELFGDPEGACSWFREMIFRYKDDNSIQKPVCLLFGGELTVNVTGKGKGGRNQHLALTAALRLGDIPGITFLSAGTDGNDGNTNMAGAVIDSDTVHDAQSKYIYPEKYLTNFDSFNFFKSAGGHIYTGPTMTNVMDIVVILI